MSLRDLFKSKSNNSDWHVRKEYVKKLNNEKKLIEIVKNDPSTDVREEAVKKIKDEKVLKDIAKNDADEYVRLLAAEKINDQETFEYLAKNGKSTSKGIAIVKLTNTKVLEDLAENAPLQKDREIARHRLNKIKK